MAVAVLCLCVGAAAPAAADGCAAVIGHRGDSASAPENTVRALRTAVANGAGRVEIDVRRTADGRLVLLHDASLARTTDVEQRFPGEPWGVSALPYASIRQLDAGSWKDGVRARVPRVARALDLNAPLLLEPKVSLGTSRVYRVAVQGDVIVQTFDVAWARRFAAKYPEIGLWILSKENVAAETIVDWSAWVDGLSVHHAALDPVTVGAAHEAGMSVAAWTVTDQVTAQSMVSIGVDRIITPSVAEATSWVGC